MKLVQVRWVWFFVIAFCYWTKLFLFIKKINDRKKESSDENKDIIKGGKIRIIDSEREIILC